MLKTREDVETLEKTRGQLQAVQREISILSKKSPNDGLNAFKLKMINSIVLEANRLLGESYKPVAGFDAFDEDDLPSTSDVAFVVAQYLQEIARFRSDHVVYDRGRDVYLLEGEPSDIRAN